MATRKPLVMIAGSVQELPADDKLLGGRELLGAPRSYFVRTDGSDSNNGLSNTAGGAFATIQKAIDVAAAFDLNGFTATIQVADGTYPEALALRQAIGDGAVAIRGNMTTPASVVIQSVVGTSVATRYTIEGLSLSYGAAVIRLSSVRSDVSYGTVIFGSASYAHVSAAAVGRASAIGPVTIAGSAPAHLYAGTGGSAELRSRAVTLAGGPAFTTAFAFAQLCGVILADGNTFTGTATGPRYSSALNGVVFVNGAGATYLPGNASGTTATGGQYA